MTYDADTIFTSLPREALSMSVSFASTALVDKDSSWKSGGGLAGVGEGDCGGVRFEVRSFKAAGRFLDSGVRVVVPGRGRVMVTGVEGSLSSLAVGVSLRSGRVDARARRLVVERGEGDGPLAVRVWVRGEVNATGGPGRGATRPFR